MEKKKSYRVFATVIGIAVVVTIIGVALGGGNSGTSDTGGSREEIIARQFSAWDGSHVKLVRYVKDHMNDPRSFEHVETKYRDDGKTVFLQMTFRGNNALGAKVLDTVTATADPRTGEILTLSSEN